MEELFDEHPFLVMFGALIIFVSAMFIGCNLMAEKSCHAEYAPYNPQYGFWSDCRVMWQGKLTPVDMINKVDLSN